jgi:type II secretory pathway component PulM
MPDGTWKGAISLGLFRQEELAAALQRSITERGVKGARVAPRGPSPGRITLQVRPVPDAVVAELGRLRASMPEAVARPCAPKG